MTLYLLLLRRAPVEVLHELEHARLELGGAQPGQGAVAQGEADGGLVGGGVAVAVVEGETAAAAHHALGQLLLLLGHLRDENIVSDSKYFPWHWIVEFSLSFRWIGDTVN